MNQKYESVDIPEESKKSIRFLYNTIPGRIFLKLTVRPTISKLAGLLLSSPASRFMIKGFIESNDINTDEYPDVEYKSFNEFFKRKIKEGYRPFPEDKNDLASPADSKLTVYPITETGIFEIKNSTYSVESLLKNKTLANEFKNGTCLVFRLSPDDYHRYAFIDDGEILDQVKIKGILHTVRPIAYQNRPVFCENTREYTVIQSKTFGKIIQAEIGALFVGKISNHKKSLSILRQEEKGTFEFGGSTIVMLFQKNTVTIDDEIIDNTNNNKETTVKMGQKIGYRLS